MADSITFKDAPSSASSASSDGYELNRSFELKLNQIFKFMFLCKQSQHKSIQIKLSFVCFQWK